MKAVAKKIKAPEITVNPDGILIAEYEYASQVAAQTNTDRVNVYNFVIGNILTVIGAITIPSLNESIPKELFSLVFVVLGFVGFMSLIQLIRLRTAWLDAVSAMNKVKQFYIDRSGKALNDAFRWHTHNVPNARKIFSVHFVLVITLIAANSFASAAAWYFMNTSRIDVSAGTIGLFGLTALLQLLVWFTFSK